ncbi:nucleotidyltransferase domain-containing protein [Cupriavidus sp. MP-37]|uniref:nucleotidyltransferase domain-containing protein n=1 Tax=Cupriavidus sp. MP-37 TaxID=2884455 RepID=UPI001D0A1346|nr:nucleotidyltransferase domain-containing protein [Cupriavidus sp. MP-37]UDM50928.1 nucleotidyltransferase domain-containing protein [Cupriavidus sp. MP-37]
MLVTMTDNVDARARYFLACAQELFGESLSGVAETDSYLRQPDYSSRAAGHYYLVLHGEEAGNTAFRARYLQAEFPELVLNYLTERELAGYPPHGAWQFHTCPWIYRSERVDKVLKDGESDLPDAIRQALFGSAHIARLYYLRNLSAETHTWGVRQLGWAMRYTEKAICKLLGLLEKGEYGFQTVAGLNEDDMDWLAHANQNWQPIERLLLKDVDTFRLAAARVSGIVESYSAYISSCFPETQPLVAKEAEVPSKAIGSMTDAIVTALQAAFRDRLLSFYLHGSAARGDMRPDSDIDTMAIFDHVDAELLERVRLIQSKFSKLTISVYSADNIKNYPRFRRYGLVSGTRHIAGPLGFGQGGISRESAYGIINNAYTIRQVARGYLVAGAYGQRSHYMLSLMVKLADHGCLRPLQQLESGHYPENRSAAIAYFSGEEQASALLHYASRLNEEEARLRECLLKGKRDCMGRHWFKLDDFATAVEKKARRYLT